MKKAIFCGLLAISLVGCSSEYLISTTDGQMLASDGKPHLDRDTGMYEFRDVDGRKQQIPQGSVKQIMER